MVDTALMEDVSHEEVYAEEPDSDTVELRNLRSVLAHPDSLLTVLDTTSDGIRLLGRLEDGDITDLIVQDPAGHTLPTTFVQQKAKGKQMCQICVKVAGKTNCWDVPCDKIVILPDTKPTQRLSERDGEIDEIRIFDARPRMAEMSFSEGAHAFYTTPDGVEFSARVEGGEVVEWLAHDDTGRELPTTVYQKKPKPKPGRPTGEAIRCFVCTPSHGCTEIRCDRIRVVK